MQTLDAEEEPNKKTHPPRRRRRRGRGSRRGRGGDRRSTIKGPVKQRLEPVVLPLPAVPVALPPPSIDIIKKYIQGKIIITMMMYIGKKYNIPYPAKHHKGKKIMQKI